MNAMQEPEREEIRCEEIGCGSIAGWRIDAGIGVSQYACMNHVGTMLHSKNYSVVVPLDARMSELDELLVPTLGTIEERLRITMDAAIKYFRERNKLRLQISDMERPQEERCRRCDGDGKAHGSDRPFEWHGDGTYPGPCPVCNGTGVAIQK